MNLLRNSLIGVCAVLAASTLWYREQYQDERTAAMELAAAQDRATIEAQEIAAERRQLFFLEQQERLEQRNQELINRNKLEQAALNEAARMNEAANELIDAQFAKIEELKAKHEALRHRVPDDAIRLFEQPARKDPHDSTRVYSGTGPR